MLRGFTFPDSIYCTLRSVMPRAKANCRCVISRRSRHAFQFRACCPMWFLGICERFLYREYPAPVLRLTAKKSGFYFRTFALRILRRPTFSLPKILSFDLIHRWLHSSTAYFPLRNVGVSLQVVKCDIAGVGPVGIGFIGIFLPFGVIHHSIESPHPRHSASLSKT